MSRTVCVFCGSQLGRTPAWVDAAQQLGHGIVERGWRLVYGGGNIGLMGVVARSALEVGGEVIGVIPQSLLEREVGLHEVSQLIVTDTMYERKALMDSMSDMFLVLPGGYGTLDELMEMLTLRQLGLHTKPILLLNLDGYYDHLLQFFTHAVQCGYLAEKHLALYHVVEDVAHTFSLLDQYGAAP